MHRDTKTLEFLGDDAGGAHLLEADLGMGVEVAAQGGQFVGIGTDAVDRAHGGSVQVPSRLNGVMVSYSSWAAPT